MGKESCYSCCQILSVAGVIILILFGLLIDFQPHFVHGLEGTNKQEGCYYGAAVYGGTFILSTLLLKYSQRQQNVPSAKLVVEPSNNSYGEELPQKSC